MRHENEKGQQTSFFARHLHITGIEESDSITFTDVESDVRKMEGFELPTLYLRSATKSFEKNESFRFHFVNSSRKFFDEIFSSHNELLGLAAMVLLFILPFSTFQKNMVIDHGLRTKGGVKVIIYQERHNQVTQVTNFEESLGLQNGDRIRVEILSGTQINAYYFISSKAQSRVLTAIDEMLADRMTLAPGGRAIFPGSIELVGENEGEVLNILFCEVQLMATHIAVLINEYSRVGVVPPKGCLLNTIRLR